MKVASKKDSVTVDWKWNPMSTVSLKAQKETATHILLNKSNADVLVEPQYIVTRRGIFRRRSVTVTGYPATYTDFRPMTEADAEKIATINGDYNTVMVNPVISTTTGKVVKPAQKPKGQPFSRVNKKNRHQFVNILGGATINLEYNAEDGYHFGAMCGSYGNSWGWYGKLVLNSAMCDDDDYNNNDRSRKWTPILTIGAIKTLGRGFSAFAGIGGYFVEQSTKFTIPVEIGFMKRFKSINVMLGATYATPLSSYGGNINPFLGVGYSF